VFALEPNSTIVAALVCVIVKIRGWAAHDWNYGSNSWLVLSFHVFILLL
jgi:hypothetical protein